VLKRVKTGLYGSVPRLWEKNWTLIDLDRSGEVPVGVCSLKAKWTHNTPGDEKGILVKSGGEDIKTPEDSDGKGKKSQIKKTKLQYER